MSGLEVLTIEEVAGVLKCSPRSVWRIIESGLLEAFNLRGPGSALRVTRSALDAYVRREIDRFQLDNGAA